MKKKILCLFLVLSILIMSTNVQAKEMTAEDWHYKTIEELKKSKTNFMDEYDIIKEIKEIPTSELKDLSDEKIMYIKSGKAEQDLKNSFLKKSKMTYLELKGLNYSDEEIRKIKSINENTSLEEIQLMGFMEKVIPYAEVLSHTYDPNYVHSGKKVGKTDIIVRWGWSWSGMPQVLGTDKVVLSWYASNGSFKFESGYYPVSPSSSVQLNRHYTVHKTELNQKVHHFSSMMVETQFNYGENAFKLLQAPTQPGDVIYGKEGYGFSKLSSLGEVMQAKLLFKYGHSTIGTEPSVSVKGDVSFSFDLKTNEYSIPSVINSSVTYN